jgi:hypothetical protein
MGAVAGIHQHRATRHSRRVGRPDLIECDLDLGLKADLLGHTGLLAAGHVTSPSLRKI